MSRGERKGEEEGWLGVSPFFPPQAALHVTKPPAEKKWKTGQDAPELAAWGDEAAASSCRKVNPLIGVPVVFGWGFSDRRGIIDFLAEMSSRFIQGSATPAGNPQR